VTLPRDLDGQRLAQALIRYWGYREVNRVGSISFCRPTRLNITGSQFPIMIRFGLVL
jgi:hypothetical protein